MGVVFNNRQQAGELLAEKLSAHTFTDGIVVGLPRGGMVVAHAVSKKLNLPLDCLVVKKIPSPAQKELGIGALAPDNISYIDWKLAQRVAADEYYIKLLEKELSDQITKKLLLYRKDRKPLTVKNKTIIIVDDGAATGATMQAAILWLRKKKAKRVIVALPVATANVVQKIKPEVSAVFVLETPNDFNAVGQFYRDFPQVEDTQVISLI